MRQPIDDVEAPLSVTQLTSIIRHSLTRRDVYLSSPTRITAGTTCHQRARATSTQSSMIWSMPPTPPTPVYRPNPTTGLNTRYRRVLSHKVIHSLARELTTHRHGAALTLIHHEFATVMTWLALMTCVVKSLAQVHSQRPDEHVNKGTTCIYFPRTPRPRPRVNMDRTYVYFSRATHPRPRRTHQDRRYLIGRCRVSGMVTSPLRCLPLFAMCPHVAHDQLGHLDLF